VIHGGHIADLRGLSRIDQALALGAEEIRGRAPDDSIAIITA
jgi:hypothetical protein